jgi:predicted permease
MKSENSLWRDISHDVFYALRQIRLAPVFAITVVLTMALGIGATTAIFSLIHSVMLKSLPVVDPKTLYRVGDGKACCVVALPQNNWGLYSYELFQRLQAATPEFEELTAFQAGRPQFSVRREKSDHPAAPMTSEYVMGNYFQTLGVSAYAGRTIHTSDDSSSSPAVAVLSYRAWQQQYGSDPTVIGSVFVTEGHPFTIVGVAPPGFFGETLSSDPPELWIPLQQERIIAGAKSHFKDPLWAWLRVIGRLKPGASTNAMPARLTAVLRQWFQYEMKPPTAYLPQVPKLAPRQHIRVVPGGAGVNAMKEKYGESLYLLLSVSGLVLLIACANIANLLLARSKARSAQTAVRMALGASRSRLIRQVLTESLVLSFCGGIAGLIIAFLGVKFIVLLTFPRSHSVPISAAPSLPVLAFALGLSCITGMLFGVVPAWFASRAKPIEALRGTNRSTRDRSSLPQRAFVVLQATLSFVLLFGAGLLTHSLEKLQNQDFGYDLDDHTIVQVAGPLSTYSPEKLDALYQELANRLSHLPGVTSAALAECTPFLGEAGEFLIRAGEDTPDVDSDRSSNLDYVTPNYLATMGERVLRGRGLTEQDTNSTRNVAVVDENFVHRFFKPGEEPLGAHFGLVEPRYSSTYEIVGIVNKVNYYDATGGGGDPIFFAPLKQYVHYDTAELQDVESDHHIIDSIVLQTKGNTDGLESQLHRVLGEIDPDLSIRRIQTMREQIDANFDQQRAVARLSSLFGILALLLAAIGLYGVTAYLVEQRTGEIGVRMALGANQKHILLLVLRGAFLQILIGLILGIPFAIGSGQLIAAQLYQVKSWDPLVLLVSIASLVLCAFVASIIPARRAAMVEPAHALRAE